MSEEEERESQQELFLSLVVVATLHSSPCCDVLSAGRRARNSGRLTGVRDGVLGGV